MNSFTITLIVLVVLILTAISIYNRLVQLRIRAREALSDIDVQLKRRFDLIPNLIETVKGYMKHERTVLENVTQARTRLAGVTGNPLERNDAENTLSGTLKTLFAVAENYPELKANTNFLQLQQELSDTEDKIQAARRFYNTNVRDLNTAIQTFPSNILASFFGFKEEKFFEVENKEEKEPVKVKF